MYASPQIPTQVQTGSDGQGMNELTQNEDANASNIMNIIKSNVDSNTGLSDKTENKSNENPAYSIIKNDIERANSNLRKTGGPILFNMEKDKVSPDKNNYKEENNITKKVEVKTT